jgi:ribosome maturation factor RimP
VRVDFPDSMPGSGVTVEDCARVSRVIEGWLDELPAVPERYVLEVSSPGVERPLARRRDFVRFAGREVRLRAAGGAFGTADRDGQVRGTLEGVEGDGEEYSVVLRTTDGDRLHLPRGQIGAANLVFHWNEDG